MTVARSQIVDVEVTPWYHVISKTVRGAFLLDHPEQDRKLWIEERLQELTAIFAVEVAGFAILDNHLHVLVKLEPQRVNAWSDEEVVRRWGKLFPRRGKGGKPLPANKDWIEQQVQDPERVAKLRLRLSDLGWLMKSLKEPLARMANKTDDCQGNFWQGRFRSVAILDEEALLATCAYIDLNPVAAGIALLPEDSEHTSVKTRVDHCRDKGRLDELQAIRESSAEAVKQQRGLESGLWLCPIEDRREKGETRSGLLPDFSLGHYLQLVDASSRLVREGKAFVAQEVAALLDRLNLSAETWRQTLRSMFDRKRPFGVAFSFHRDRLRAFAARRGLGRMANLNGAST